MTKRKQYSSSSSPQKNTNNTPTQQQNNNNNNNNTPTQQQNNNKNKTKTVKISGEVGNIKSYYTRYFPWTSNARNDHRRTNGRQLVIGFQRPVNRQWSPQDELTK